MDRRNFLKYTLGTSVLTSINVFAKTNSKNNPNFLFVLLRGGADGLSILVPYNDNNYYEQRPRIAIPKEKCVTINDTFGLNPTLNNYVDWYKNNQLVFIPAAGQINNSRSHFQAQDVLEFGVNNITTYKSGFLGRMQEILGVSKSISFTEDMSPILTNEKLTIPNVSINQLRGVFNFKTNIVNYSGELNNIYSNVEKNIKIIEDIKGTNGKLSNVGKFMKEGNYNIGFVDFNDWDTHSEQGALDGRLNFLLANLNKELKEFEIAVGDEYWKNTIVVVMSEFGRKFKQNGNGSDHGHGNLMTILGGMISKSNIVGDWLDLKEKNLHQNRDLPVFYEYRDILGELFIKMYGLNNSEINYIFPNVNPTKFNLI